MIVTVKNKFDELVRMLYHLSDDQYTRKILELNGATIGEHTRHIIEMFQCLIQQYDTGEINYDKRARNREIERSRKYAIDAIEALFRKVNQEDNIILVNHKLSEKENIQVNSTYYRELLYNIEHCTHHQALIKVALMQFDGYDVDQDFGVATSTILYRNQLQQAN